jgi:hypothetical protein
LADAALIKFRRVGVTGHGFTVAPPRASRYKGPHE